STPPVTKVLRISGASISPVSRRSKAQNMKVTGTRKLPSRTSVGTRVGLPVMNVTTTVSSHSSSPERKIRTQGRRARPARGVLVVATSASGPPDTSVWATHLPSGQPFGVEGGPLGADPGQPVEVAQRRRARSGPLQRIAGAPRVVHVHPQPDP